MENDLQKRIEKLERDLQDLNDEIYRTNFSAQQDFNKSSTFTTRLRVPVYTTKPTSCDIGEICSQGGKLWHCSAANTWTNQT
jgi:hypothetical protein